METCNPVGCISSLSLSFCFFVSLSFLVPSSCLHVALPSHKYFSATAETNSLVSSTPFFLSFLPYFLLNMRKFSIPGTDLEKNTALLLQIPDCKIFFRDFASGFKVFSFIYFRRSFFSIVLFLGEIFLESSFKIPLQNKALLYDTRAQYVLDHIHSTMGLLT